MGEAVRCGGSLRCSTCRHGAWGRQCVAEVPSVVAPAVMGHGASVQVGIDRNLALFPLPIAHCPLPIAHCPTPNTQPPTPNT
jgi:hypothetical protein